LLALAAALAVHLGLWLWSTAKPPSLETWSAEVAARIHALLGYRHVMELEQPAPPPVPPAERESRTHRSQRGGHQQGQGQGQGQSGQGQGEVAKPKPQAAAQAGQVVTAEPVVDLTGLTGA